MNQIRLYHESKPSRSNLRFNLCGKMAEGEGLLLFIVLIDNCCTTRFFALPLIVYKLLDYTTLYAHGK